MSRKSITVIIKSSKELVTQKGNTSKNSPADQSNKGYYGYGYFGYNYYYDAVTGKNNNSQPGPYMTYKKTSKVVFPRPAMIENNIIVPDSMVLYAGEKQEVKPFVAPDGGNFAWEAAGNISVQWASLKASAFIQGINEGTAYAKVTYTDGNKVITKKINNKVVLTVKDNGNGIPQKVIDKIFQPFFTTKPTGEGTGLGLSLSYDSVKAQGGELTVETKEIEGASFIVTLPVKKSLPFKTCLLVHRDWL